MEFLEKDLEDIIWDAPSDELLKRGLYIKGKIRRQVKVGSYGIADIVSIEKQSEIHPICGIIDQTVVITVFELKKQVCDVSALMQAARYATGIEQYLNKRKLFGDVSVVFRIVLIGKSICKSDFCYLPSFMDNLHVYTYKYTFSGIEFKSEYGYVLTNPGF